MASHVVIIGCIKRGVLGIDVTNDLIVTSDSKCADFLYSILQDLTIINELSFSKIFFLLNQIEDKPSVLARSINFTYFAS